MKKKCLKTQCPVAVGRGTRTRGRAGPPTFRCTRQTLEKKPSAENQHHSPAEVPRHGILSLLRHLPGLQLGWGGSPSPSGLARPLRQAGVLFKPLKTFKTILKPSFLKSFKTFLEPFKKVSNFLAKRLKNL